MRRRGGERALNRIARTLRLAITTLRRFLDHDGWAIASHIALSTLMSLFPFFIVVASLASLAGSSDLADGVARLLFDAWPAEVAEPIAREIRNVLTVTRRDVLTFGALFALYFSSSGI